MLSDEEKEIFNNLKEYMQSEINKGYHKFIYNDLDWDFKCIDCINAIDKVLKQSKEIEELSDKLTEKICKGVEEEILEEYRQTIISKDKEIEELKDANKFYNTAYNLGKTYSNKRWEEKIKAKIEEVKDGTFDAKIVLQSLLEKE